MTTASPPVDADAARLAELGYEQQLARRLRTLDNAALGFSVISPVVGLYAVVLVGTSVAGPAWVWVLPSRSPGNACGWRSTRSSHLSSRSPAAPTNGADACSAGIRRFTGWVAICAYAVANTTIAYLGAPWALTVAGIAVTPNRIVITGMVLVVVCALAGSFGVTALSRALRAGVGAKAVASVGVGVILLLAFRTQDFSALTHTLGAEASSGGSVIAGLLAALAVGGWVLIGFDGCVGAAEETREAASHVPRAIRIAMPSVAALVILNAVAATLAHPDRGRWSRARILTR